MKTVSGELFNGTKAVRLQDLPDEAWTVIAGEGGGGEAAKLYAVVSWLYRCVDVRAGAVANMPFEIRRGDEVVMTHDDDAPEQLAWLNELPGLLYRTEAALALTGQAYWFRERNLVRTLAVRWLRPDSVRPDIDSDGLKGFRRHVGGRDIDLTADDLVYFWLPDPFVEIGPAEHYPGRAALSAAGALSSLDRFLTGYFDRGMVKATLLKYTTPLGVEESKRVKEWWRRVALGVKNAFAAEVVRGDFDTVVVGEGVKDLQNTALTAEQRESVCTALGVPQSKVTANAANYATANQDARSFIQDTIAPECKFLAQVINRQLLGPMGLTLAFLPESLPIMQEDEAARAGSFKLYRDGGLSIKEAAAILGIDMPEGLPAAPVAPADEGTPPPADGGAVTEQRVLNGAQIQSALSIIDTFAQGKLPRSNAVYMVQTFFNIAPDMADKLIPTDGAIVAPVAVAQPVAIGATAGNAERIEETRRFLRWARKRANPDPEQFESVLLTPGDKELLLSEVKGDGDAADDAPFQGDWRGYP